MSSPLKLQIKSGRLPFNYDQPLGQQFFRDIIARMSARVDGSNTILGNGGTTGKIDLGPDVGFSGWWWFWDKTKGAYQPTQNVIQDPISSHTITLSSSSPFFARYIDFPNKIGMVALATDVASPRPTVLFDASSGTFSVDSSSLDGNGAATTDFYGRLTKNTTISAVTMLEGQAICIAVSNIGTAYTLTWPAAIKWPGGTEPAQISGIGGAGMGLYYLYRINSNYYGVVITTTAPPTQVVDTGSFVPRGYGEPGGGGKSITYIA